MKTALFKNFTVVVCLLVGAVAKSLAAEDDAYRIEPGDVVNVSVWHEADLQKDLLVRPDGRISLPLVGELKAAGKSVEQLRQEITDAIAKYIADASVTVSLLQLAGNKIYVVGKVNHPGEFVANRNLDVMQALSMAGGAARFAAVKEILVLRRNAERQQAIAFNYDQVASGRNLEQNIMLQAGDVVVVP